MYIYTAKSEETGEELKKEFEEHGDARDFADLNLREYPEYEVYDEEQDEIIYSNELDEDNEATARENMYPDGDEEDI